MSRTPIDIGQNELINRIAKRSGITIAEARFAYLAVVNEIREVLMECKELIVPQWGTFKWRRRAGRTFKRRFAVAGEKEMSQPESVFLRFHWGGAFKRDWQERNGIAPEGVGRLPVKYGPKSEERGRQRAEEAKRRAKHAE